MKSIKNHKASHLTLDQRIEIQGCLQHGMTFKAIGRRIGKDQTTVSKEVKKHIAISASSVVRKDKNGNRISGICPKLLKPPFVCNSCTRRSFACAFDKHIYSAKQAQKQYTALLRSSREGLPLSKESFYQIDRIITEGIQKGQHLYHIMQTNNLNVSKATVYRHLKKGYLSVAAIDFPRVVKFKPRGLKYQGFVPKAIKIGRTYDKFLEYIADNDITYYVEMDTVIGRIGGKVLLTLNFNFCNFMLGYLMDNKSSASVTSAITTLKQALIDKGFAFGDIFPVILTDNGGEFSNIFAIENALNGEKECNLFFCDPCQSCQKPHVEKNHTLLRDILPQGSSFDSLTQNDIDIIFSHINSVKRKTLNAKTPYEVYTFTYSNELTDIFRILPISPAEVLQSPKLLSKVKS